MTVLLDEADPSSLRKLVFRLAPLRVVPHSVHLFLSQIADGIWSRGTPAVVLRADHVLQACPHPCLDSAGDPYADLRRLGLDAVAFQEYSPEFPHERYTIGFAGRPRSGPEFYINLMDNTVDHGTPEERRARMGPAEYAAWAEEEFGGPEEAALHESAMEPYPCFGKLVEGFDAVDEMAKGMTRASLPREENSEEEDTVELDEHMLLRPMRISSMTILEDYNPAATGGGGDGEKGGKERGPTTNDEL